MPMPNAAPMAAPRSPHHHGLADVDRHDLPRRGAQASQDRDGVDLPHDPRVDAAGHPRRLPAAAR
jgi:hypothetical protein